MKLTVLVDNYTNIDEYYLGEPGVSYYIEDTDATVLFDTGYSDILLRNAEALHKEMTRVSKIVLSHGHDDHTRGLKFMQQEGLLTGKEIIAHPDTFWKKESDGLSIGAPFSEEELCKITKLTLVREPIKISEHLTYLAEIPQVNAFEKRKIIGKMRKNAFTCGRQNRRNHWWVSFAGNYYDSTPAGNNCIFSEESYSESKPVSLRIFRSQGIHTPGNTYPHRWSRYADGGYINTLRNSTT